MARVRPSAWLGYAFYSPAPSPVILAPNENIIGLRPGFQLPW